MADAEVGDDEYGEDPTVNRLQSLAAAALGTEAALYMPSGTMANQLAIRVLSRPGTEVLCPARSHVYQYELAASPQNSGVQLHPLWDVPDGIVAAVEGMAIEFPPVSMLTLENTYMAMSGAPTGADEMRTLVELGRGGGLRVHVDGARIWNAAIATGAAPSALIGGADTVMFCLSKGLGAPVGLRAVRPGRRDRGGAGAAPPARRRDAAGRCDRGRGHRRARDDGRAPRRRSRACPRLADALADRWPGSVDPASIRTNIVCARLDALPEHFVARLGAAGVRVGTIDPRTVRLVTHKDVDDDDVDARHRRARRAASRLTWSTTTSPSACSRSTPIPTTPRSRPAARSPAGPTRAPTCTCSSRPRRQGHRRSRRRPRRARRSSASRRPRPPPRVLGVTPHHLDHPDGELADDRALRLELVRSVRAVRPDVVCCPDPTAVFFGDGYFNHRDHRITGWAALDAVAPAAGNPHYFPELRAEGLDVHSVAAVYLSGTLEPNTWVDITATLERKIEALFCHASQLVETGDWFRQFLRDSAELRRPRRRGHVRGGVPPDRGFLSGGSRPDRPVRTRPSAERPARGWACHSAWARIIEHRDDAGADRGQDGADERAAERASGHTTAWRRGSREPSRAGARRRRRARTRRVHQPVPDRAAEDAADDDRREHQRRARRAAGGWDARPARRSRTSAIVLGRSRTRRPLGARLHPMALHEWTVAGGLIETDAGVLLVRNVRRGGIEDWSTPGRRDRRRRRRPARGPDARSGRGDRARRARSGSARSTKCTRTRPTWAGGCGARCTSRSRSKASSGSTIPTASWSRRASSRPASATSTSSPCAPWVREPLSAWLARTVGAARRAATSDYEVNGTTRESMRVVRSGAT